MKQYTACLIGTGRIGFSLGFDKKREQPASHTMALLKEKRIRLVAGCDTDKEKLGAWGRYVKRYVPGARTFSDADTMLSEIKTDIIVIAVNEDAHLEAAIKAINAKPKLVILEKPVALNSENGNRIKEEAQKCGVPVMINHERRFAEDYRIAKDYIPKIGKMQAIKATLFSGMRVYSAKNEDDGGYSLLHDGTHLVDIVQFFLEPLPALGKSEEHCILQNPVITGVHYDEKEPEVIRNLSAHFSHPDCSDITMEFSGRSRYFGFEVEITGTEGRIKIGNGFAECQKREESKLYTGFYSLAKDKSVKFPKKTGYFANMISGACDFLDGTAPLYSSLENGLNVLHTLEEIKNAVLSLKD